MANTFGPFALDDSARQLCRGDEAIHLSSKAFDLLILLAQRRPQAISKSSLLDALWQDTFVTEGNLAVLIKEIRDALGDNAQRPTFVRTVQRFGYAFYGTAVAAATFQRQRPAGSPGGHSVPRSSSEKTCWDETRQRTWWSTSWACPDGTRRSLSPLRRSRSATSRARTGRSPTASAAGILIADPKGPRRSNGEALEEPLTPRETDVLELLAEGLANKPIAARLGISDQTLKFHVASICGKLGAANRTDAVRRAVRRGLVSL